MVNKTEISREEQIAYQQDGFIQLTHVLDKTTLNTFAGQLRMLMKERDPNVAPMEERSTYKRAFTQVTNLWQQSDLVRNFVFNEDLARLAAQIMGVDGVRLYHDQALFKEVGGGPTPWHVDQAYWPMDTNHTCTFWIPLQDTSMEMGPLAFAAGSHLLPDGRDMVISEESESFFSDLLKDQNLHVSRKAFNLGDLSVHSGWTVHNAVPNLGKQAREVMTIIYMADGVRLLAELNETQTIDRDAFIPDVPPGGLAATHLNPLLYPRES